MRAGSSGRSFSRIVGPMAGARAASFGAARCLRAENESRTSPHSTSTRGDARNHARCHVNHFMDRTDAYLCLPESRRLVTMRAMWSRVPPAPRSSSARPTSIRKIRGRTTRCRPGSSAKCRTRGRRINTTTCRTRRRTTSRRPRRSGSRPTGRSPSWWPASAPAGRSRASAGTSRSGTRRSRCGASTPTDRCSRSTRRPASSTSTRSIRTSLKASARTSCRRTWISASSITSRK